MMANERLSMTLTLHTRPDEELVEIMSPLVGVCTYAGCGREVAEARFRWTTPQDPTVTLIYGPQQPFPSLRHADGTPGHGELTAIFLRPVCKACGGFELDESDTGYVTVQTCRACGHSSGFDRGD